MPTDARSYNAARHARHRSVQLEAWLSMLPPILLSMCTIGSGRVCEISLRFDALLDESKKLRPMPCLFEAPLPKGDDKARRLLLRVGSNVLASDGRDNHPSVLWIGEESACLVLVQEKSLPI